MAGQKWTWRQEWKGAQLGGRLSEQPMRWRRRGGSIAGIPAKKRIPPVTETAGLMVDHGREDGGHRVDEDDSQPQDVPRRSQKRPRKRSGQWTAPRCVLFH